MIQSMDSIIFLFKITCDYWIPLLISSVSEIGWTLGFQIGLPVGMVLGAHFGSPLGYSMKMLLGFSIGNYFRTWEGYLVVI